MKIIRWSSIEKHSQPCLPSSFSLVSSSSAGTELAATTLYCHDSMFCQSSFNHWPVDEAVVSPWSLSVLKVWFAQSSDPSTALPVESLAPSQAPLIHSPVFSTCLPPACLAPLSSLPARSISPGDSCWAASGSWPLCWVSAVGVGPDCSATSVSKNSTSVAYLLGPSLHPQQIAATTPTAQTVTDKLLIGNQNLPTCPSRVAACGFELSFSFELFII